MGNNYNHRQINKLLRLTESNANILEDLINCVERMEAELQKFRQNQYEWSDSEFERFSASPPQYYKQQPPPYHHQPPPQLDQLNDAGETSSDEECEWGFCLVTRQNQHLSKVDLIPLFKKNLSFDEFSEWVTEVERFFEFYEIPEDEQVEFVAYRLEEQAFSWWELIQNLNRRFNKQPIKEWTEMKEMLMARFLDINCFVTEEYQSSHAES
ncbi:unnamed protein product [Lactuca virosa]|uniref:Retrotransposon gag domain-containing protein n=1 Tax=Lactuca virosa TaxID=75947 RepID=A0AAU9P8E8_9ASTR|nr:unnamed protein product [Lactuca virosa]